jgi:RNA polymerase sigma factor (sigma-70 family)
VTLDAAWKELLPRLEADLSARQSSSSRMEIDDDPWGSAEHLLRTSARLLHTILRASPEDTDDVVQETMLKLQSSRTMQRLRAAGSPAGYVMVMMRNAFADLSRRRFREVPTEGLPEEMISGELSLEVQPQNSGDIERLKAALRSLRPEDRYLLRMRFWKNMSLNEISNSIGITYSATAVRIFRILSRLRRAMIR